jgi:hypothetical protein
MGRHQNGALHKPIERDAFEVFLTGDKNMETRNSLKVVLLPCWLFRD